MRPTFSHEQLAFDPIELVGKLYPVTELLQKRMTLNGQHSPLQLSNRVAPQLLFEKYSSRKVGRRLWNSIMKESTKRFS